MMAEDKQEKPIRKLDKQKLSLIIIVACAIVVVAVAVGVSAYFLSRNSREITVFFQTEGDQYDSIRVKWGETPTLPQPQQIGSDFLGWYTEDGKLADDDFWKSYDFLHDLTLHPVWNISDPVTVTYDARGGQAVEPKIVPRGYSRTVAGQTEKEGFHLLEWCLDEQCLSTYYPGYVIDRDITLYAKWLPKEISEDAVSEIVYNTMGGAALERALQKQGTVISLPTIHRAGFAFAGWYSDSEYLFPVDSETLVTQSCVIYARWEARDPVTITFVMPDGAPSYEARTVDYDTEIDSFEPSAPRWDGYRFDGFFTSSQYDTRVSFPFFAIENSYVYLKYTSLDIAQVYVTFFLYEEKEQIVSQTELYNEGDKIASRMPTRDDYVFAGWFADKDFSQPFDFDHTFASDGLIIYAKWIAREAYGENNLLYERSADGTYQIIVGEVDRNVDVVVISDSYDGLPIREIADNAFFGRAFITILFGRNINLIGKKAFANCNLVQQISLPSGVTTIEQEAFIGCQSLETLEIAGSASIGARAFKDCTELKRLDAASVHSIGTGAFEGCISLQTVDITYVGELSAQAFYNCTQLSSINLSQGSLTNVPSQCFYGCAALSKIDLPSSVKTIYAQAFAYTGLESFDTKGVQKIYSEALEFTRKLKEFTIRSALTVLEPNIMEGSAPERFFVDGNSNFSAPDGSLYSKDGKNLIQYAGKDESFTIGKNVSSIEAAAFLTARGLSNVVVDKDNPKFYAEGGILYSKDKKTLLWYPSSREATSYTVASFVTTIGSGAFVYADALETIVLPSTVTTANLWAFYRLSSLARIVCKGSVLVSTEGDMATVYDCPNVEIVRES